MIVSRFVLICLWGVALGSLLFVAAGGWCLLGVPETWSQVMCAAQWLATLAGCGVLWFEFRAGQSSASPPPDNTR